MKILLPLQGVYIDNVPIPRVLPWAMYLLPFQGALIQCVI